MIPVRVERPSLSVSFWRAALLASGLIALLVLAPGCGRSTSPGEAGDPYALAMNVGRNYYDRGEAQRAIEPFAEATRLDPTQPDAQLNLANAWLLAGDATNALRHALLAASLEANSAAAHYVAGCAYSRLRQFEAALKEFQIARDLEPTVGAATYQLARAHQELGHLEDAITLYQELTGFETNHPIAFYALSQALIRAGRVEAANAAIERHREILAGTPGTTMDTAKAERCAHTQARAPFIAEQPDAAGIRVGFSEVTREVLPDAARYGGPIGFIDFHHDGRNSLFVSEGTNGFRLLENAGGRFQPRGPTLPGVAGARYHRCLIADLQNDRYDDVLVLGDRGTHLFKFATNAQISDSSAFSRLKDVEAVGGALLDLDFTGKLDLVAINTTNQTLRILRNVGTLYFRDTTATSGVPATVAGITQVAIDDWNNDDTLDVLAARPGQPPALLLKQRGGPLVLTNSPADWPAGAVIALGDFNNDLRSDLVVATSNHLEIVFNGATNRARIPTGNPPVRDLFLVDYDNDGWLDVLASGPGLRAWRSLGKAGFRETTTALGLDRYAGDVESIAAADIDIDGDTDLAVAVAGKGLRLLRNEGGNANLQVKVRLVGNRSNASGLGTRLEVSAGGLRLGRRVNSLPIEIGVGRHATLESLNARWLNLNIPLVDAKVDPRSTLPLLELSIQEGSCPYVYAWDGRGFRFVTDILGSSPLGLRVSDSRFVEADPDEYVWLGGEADFPPRDGSHVLQITEELREVLYLDAAQLIVVDHPAGTEVHTTGKMVPGRPFPPHELIALHRPYPLRQALRSDGRDVTAALAKADDQPVSPVHLRTTHLRGLAEPWSVTLDFGPLPVQRPLALALTGWIRFGGGMANVAASRDPDLPFPFPTLEVETAEGRWAAVDVVVGTPAGKTKSIVVDLAGKLPSGSRRLRLATAYEIHWDRIALLEKAEDAGLRVTRVNPDVADLHWRGFGEIEDRPAHRPLTPSYERVRPNPFWRITPMGWCTRYGDTRELVDRRDNALVLLNGGDELTLRFAADRLPPKPAGHARGFFLYSCGWDKDSDFHCEQGWLVEPLPWHGMEDQLYGQQERPVIDGDWWIPKYNTRWVGLQTLDRRAKLSPSGSGRSR